MFQDVSAQTLLLEHWEDPILYLQSPQEPPQPPGTHPVPGILGTILGLLGWAEPLQRIPKGNTTAAAVPGKNSKSSAS